MRWRKGKHEDPAPDPDENRERVLDGLTGEPDAQPADDEGSRQARPAEPDTEPPEEAVEADADPNDGAGPVEQVEREEPDEDLVTLGPLYLDYSATSNVGKIRKNNQDSGYASGNLLVVADGMGGAAAGDLASAVAIEAIGTVDRRVEGEDMLSVLAEAIRRANDKIADLVAHDHTLEGMGTTVSGALFDGSTLGLAHIGDSRAYLVHQGELTQITHDHSWVQSLIDDGKLSPSDAANHPHRSLLLRVLNGQPVNDPDIAMVPVESGDRLLFCSDGLCGFVEDEAIAEHLAATDRNDALNGLLQAALDAGGLDNITIIIGDVVDTPPDEVPAPLILGAATEVDIPDTTVASRVIDLGDDDQVPRDTDRPSAPAPASGGMGRSAEAGPAGESSPSTDEDRYTPVAPPRWRWLRRVVAVVVIVLVIAGLGVAGVAWGRTQYYIGPADNKVAIYQGLPDKVPFIPLSRLFEVQQINIDDLPPFYQEQVRSSSITASNLESARQIVSTLRTAAATCIGKRDNPTPSDGTSPSSDKTPTKGKTPAKTPATASSAPASPTSSLTPGPNGPC